MDIDKLLERLDNEEVKSEEVRSKDIPKIHLKDKEVREVYQKTTKRLAEANKRAERSKREILKILKQNEIDYKELANISIMALGIATQDYTFMKQAEEKLI